MTAMPFVLTGLIGLLAVALIGLYLDLKDRK